MRKRSRYLSEEDARVGELLHRGGVPEAVLRPGALDYLGRVICAQARTFGFQDAFFHIFFAFVLALIPAWLLGRAGRLRAPDRARIGAWDERLSGP